MTAYTEKKRRFLAAVVVALITIGIISTNGDMWQVDVPAQPPGTITGTAADRLALNALNELKIKGRAPKTNYDRSQFGNGWGSRDGCDTRNIVLNRDLERVVVGDGCRVISGILADPYTGRTIQFQRGAGTSSDIQIDHVVALSDAWQKGAQYLTAERRETLANDPLELLAVDGSANQQKSGSDAATWLPSNKVFRCQYVARQISVKAKYNLWVTQAEYDAIKTVLSRCPGQVLPSA